MKSIVPLTSGDARKAVARFGVSPRTAAIPLLPAKADEADWLAARRRDANGGWRIGASELAAVLGISPHASPFSLWWSKQDSWVAPESTRQQSIGHLMEPLIGQLWAEAHPEMLLCRPGFGLFGHPEHRWLVCTPDFLAVRTDDLADRVCVEPVECKSDDGGKGWGAPGTDEVPEHHRVQVYVQCEVLGAPRGHLMRLAGKRPAAYVLPYDETARAEMDSWLRLGRRFIETLRDGEPPEPDGHDATTRTLTELHPAYVEGSTRLLPVALIGEYRRLHALLDTVKSQFAAAQNEVRQRLGDAQIGIDPAGNQVVKRLTYKRRGYEVGPSMVDQLRRLS